VEGNLRVRRNLINPDSTVSDNDIAQASTSQLLPSPIHQTSMSIEIAAARSRDETNLQIMKGFAERSDCHMPPSVESTSTPIPNTSAQLQSTQALPTQSILTSSAAGPSLSVRNLLSLSENMLKDHLVKIRNLLNNRDICAPCWVHRLSHSHNIINCAQVAVGYQLDRSKYRTWKSKLNMPNGHCYSCCFPQVSE
jgi:hypothetical protein